MSKNPIVELWRWLKRDNPDAELARRMEPPEWTLRDRVDDETAGGGSMSGRYILFAGDWYYPAPGWHDMQKASDSRDDLAAQGRDMVSGEEYTNGQHQWWHVVDLASGTIVEEGEREGGRKA